MRPATSHVHRAQQLAVRETSRFATCSSCDRGRINWKRYSWVPILSMFSNSEENTIHLDTRPGPADGGW